MPTWFAYVLGVFSTALGLFVLFGLALPTLRGGSTVLGALALVCAVLGTVLGLAGVIGVARQAKRRP